MWNFQPSDLSEAFRRYRAITAEDFAEMPGQRCHVHAHGNSKIKDPGVSFNSLPNQQITPKHLAVWLQRLGMEAKERRPLKHTFVGSIFPSVNGEFTPTTVVSKRSALPTKRVKS